MSLQSVDQKICVIGLGYVGLTLATVMADVGFDVLGVEIRQDVLDLLDRGEPHFHEPGLAEMLKRVMRRGNLRYTQYIPEECDSTVFIITVGTPLRPDGSVRLDMIESVSRELAGRIKDGDLVIMRSTVRLGTTRKIVQPILQQSGKVFDLAFCPERTLEGKALSELRELPQIVAGESRAAQIRSAQIFQMLTPTVVRVTDVETAEMIKMVDNAQRDVAFAYANEIARLCDAIGISAAEVIRAGKLGYARTNLPMPGPVGGPCLSKDSYILAEGLASYGVTPEITMTARRLNERQCEETVARLCDTMRQAPGFPEQPKVALLGLAFKGRPATDDLRGTMAKPILEALKAQLPNARFVGYDPVVPAEMTETLGLEAEPTLESAMTGAHMALILTNHVAFENMPLENLAELMARPSIVYDYWNMFSPNDLHLPPGTGFMALGAAGRAILPYSKD